MREALATLGHELTAPVNGSLAALALYALFTSEKNMFAASRSTYTGRNVKAQAKRLAAEEVSQEASKKEQ